MGGAKLLSLNSMYGAMVIDICFHMRRNSFL